MISKIIQKKLDYLIDKYILFLIPLWFKPNHFTYIRLILTPFLYYLLISSHYYLALLIFIIAVSTDFIDGALARTRNQITVLGNVLDPIADKLLIAIVLLFIGFEYMVIKIMLIFIAIEIIGILINVLYPKKLGKPIPANTFGKIKMISQSIAIGLFLISIIINSNILTLFSEYILFGALFFATISNILQAYRQLKGSPVVKSSGYFKNM